MNPINRSTVSMAIAGLALAGLVAAAAPAQAQQARDQIRVVGSSTVFPFTTAAAEQFGRGGKFKTPIVESTGTGGGMRLFCAGVGVQHPDITNASRRITNAEYETCGKNGVKEIVEIKVGFDGIVLAVKKGAPKVSLTVEQIWLALARQVPKDGKLVPNFYQHWNEIDAKLPNWPIEVMGPPPTSGTRDAFVELVMDNGCKGFAEIKAITDSKARQQACNAIREDGKFIEAGENDNLIVQRIASGQAGTMGVFGFSYLDQNLDKIQGTAVGGVEPTFENIASAKYPVSRSLYIYVKKAHADVIPGMKEFIAEYTSDKAMGPNGYMATKGLIPLPDAERKAVREGSMNLNPLMM